MSSALNGNLEHLVEQITDVIVARLNGEQDNQTALCGCSNECFNRCPERMQRVVDAGASRIGLVLGETAQAADWASFIDHTLLKPEASETDIARLCREAAEFHFAICVCEPDVGARVGVSFERDRRAGVYGDRVSFGSDSAGREGL